MKPYLRLAAFGGINAAAMTRLVRNFALAVTAVWPAIALTTSASCGQEKDAFTDLEYVRGAEATLR